MKRGGLHFENYFSIELLWDGLGFLEITEISSWEASDMRYSLILQSLKKIYFSHETPKKDCFCNRQKLTEKSLLLEFTFL